MKLPVQITYRNLPPSEALESLIRERAAQLDTYYDAIMRCHVLVGIPHRHHRDGKRFQVRIDLTVPGSEIVVTHEPSQHPALQDIESGEVTKATELESVHRYAHVAVREAFDVARRRLQDYARRQRGDVKLHEAPLHGTVVRIGLEGGWIQTPDDREIYFHANSVLEEAFSRLEVGSAVAFVEEEGDKGPQASTVRLLGKHHYA
jgi:cold shock CspA family protein/ribosome-associated translation inhibitor RaiA